MNCAHRASEAHLSVVSAAQTDKSYAGDNRLIAPNSSHRRRCLAPRCRLISSWRGSTFQGSGCSPVKEVRELGLERKSLRHFAVMQRSKLTKIGETLPDQTERFGGQHRG